MTSTTEHQCQDRTAAATGHGWTVESAHATSQGRVLYVKCRCGARRVDLAADSTQTLVTVGRGLAFPHQQ
ncbi:hypothetical protein ACFUCV_00105 [Specibacter sp. NPDC057265]|uniref:hypothetical protein n=1 Tax=Specibacter sp. NPDC057265 TaxID=3346075 RepID=UPI003645B069